MVNHRKKRIQTEKDGKFQELSPPLPFLPEDCIFEIAKHSIRMNYDAKIMVGAREWYIWRSVSKSMQKRIDPFYLKEYGLVCKSYDQFKLVPHLVTNLKCSDWNVDDIRDGLNDLKTSKTVKVLDIWEIDLSGLMKEVVELIETNTSITKITFDVMGLDRMETMLIMEALSKGKNITNISIHIWDGKISIDDMESIILKLKECRNLTSLNLGGHSMFGNGIVKLLCDHLTNTPLTKVYLSYSNLKVADELIRMVSSNEKITLLDLSGNYINGEVARKLFATLEKTKLLELNMSNNWWGKMEEFKIISNYISKNSTLKKFDIRANHLGNEGIQTLSQSLSVNKSITSLILSGNDLGDKGARSISEYLTSNKSLISISLGHNDISALGASLIAASLEVNQTLTRLDLRMNNIGDEGGRSIGLSLAKNKSLIYLNLSSNDIGNKGLETIEESLGINSTIQFLLLGENRISCCGAVPLIVSAKNRSLSFLDLSENDIGEKHIEFIESNQTNYLGLTLRLY